jgi:hypothetical protein
MKRLIVLLALLWPLVAFGGHVHGRDLTKWCEGTYLDEPKENMVAYGTCVGYLMGLMDSDLGPTPVVCLPDGTTNEWLRQVWLRYADKHPEEMNAVATDSAMRAFRQVWPCKK